MTQGQKKLPGKRPNLSKIDSKILELVNADPTKTTYELGKNLKHLGVSKNSKSIYSRLTKSDYLSREIDRIRQANFEMMSREVVPEAIKIHKRVLKNKKIADERKREWVALAEKVEFGTDELKRPPSQQPMINLIQIQALIAKSITLDKD